MFAGRRRSKPGARRGLAATETAITLPLLVLLVFGSIELTNTMFLKQSLRIAAYEGARAVGRAQATSVHGQTRIEEALAARRVSDYDVSISPEVTESTPRGTMLTVTVTAPVAAYSIGPMWYFNEKTISAEFRIVRL